GEPESSRCDVEQNLLHRGCSEEEVVNPRGSHRVTEQSRAGGDGETVEQLTPQAVSLSLRPGTRTALYGVTCVFCGRKAGAHCARQRPPPTPQTTADRSDQIVTVISFFPGGIITASEKRSGDQRANGFLLTARETTRVCVSVCVCDKIGWRNVTKLLVYTSDDTFHTAGDGKLGGIYLPNDGRCHLGPRGLYQEANHHDYPSVGHLAQVLSASNIQPIFAVTKKSLPIYQVQRGRGGGGTGAGRGRGVGGGGWGVAEGREVERGRVEHSNLPEGVTVSYDSHCSDQSGSVRAEQGKCSNVHIKEQVSINFTVHVGLTHCLDSEQSFEIRPLGFSEHLVVRVNSLCACNCGDLINQAPHCSDGNGSLTCGMCSCDEGRLGKRCECSADEDSRPLSEDCRRNKTDLVCSGRGQCVCGRCICRDKVHGDNCQCDDSSCEWHNGTMCGGKGRCVCGLCQCLPGYIGSACDCEDSTDQCFPVNGTVCSGHGECKCNQCECELGYQSPDCGHCLNCHLACHIIKDCVRCWVFGAQDEDCTQRCGHVIMETELPRKETNCSESFHGGRRVDFFLEKRKNNYHFQVYNQGEKPAPPPPPTPRLSSPSSTPRPPPQNRNPPTRVPPKKDVRAKVRERGLLTSSKAHFSNRKGIKVPKERRSSLSRPNKNDR
uniref:Integrin beta n=1 Tax=Callorhinchus milii TaxID=7868 RepID=A0A4W3HBE0_CALMI